MSSSPHLLIQSLYRGLLILGQDGLDHTHCSLKSASLNGSGCVSSGQSVHSGVAHG